MSLEDDEELVGVGMAVAVVASTRRQDGPAHQEIVGSGGVIDQELDLHIDPAVVGPQAALDRYVAEVGAIRVTYDIPASM